MKRLIILVSVLFFFKTDAFSQRKSLNDANINKQPPVEDTPKIENKNGGKEPDSRENISDSCDKSVLNIIPKEYKFSQEFSLINYEVGNANHPDLYCFLDKVVSYLQKSKKVPKVVTVTGWADGTTNKGISKGSIDICNECKYISDKVDKIEDVALARLRACIIHSKLTSICAQRNYSLKLNVLVNYYDEPDNETKSTGLLRKVVISIEN